jgi:anti-anti-sigma factor
MSSTAHLRITGGQETNAYVVSGEIDMDSATQIAEIPVPENGSSGIVLDFSEVTFLDSIGIWALVNLAAGLGGEKLIVAHANGAVRRTLEMADVPAIAEIVLQD